MSCKRLILALIPAAAMAATLAPGGGHAGSLTGQPDTSPFSYDTLHPGADLNPQFVDPNGAMHPQGPLAPPPALTPHQDCVPYHQQMTRDSVYPYQSGPCLPEDQK
jgi:hypothetical protein